MLLIRLIKLYNRFVPSCPFSWRSIFSVIEFVFDTLFKCLFHGQVEAPELVVNKVRQQVGALATAALLILLSILPILLPILLVPTLLLLVPILPVLFAIFLATFLATCLVTLFATLSCISFSLPPLALSLLA